MTKVKKGIKVRAKRKESHWYNEFGIAVSREKEPTKSRHPITVKLEKGNYYRLQGTDGNSNTNNFHASELDLITK